MARFRGFGFTALADQPAACQDLDCDTDCDTGSVETETPSLGAATSSTPYDWNKALASEADCVSQDEVDINRVIIERLQHETAPQQEVLGSILDTHLDLAANADLWVLRTVSIAHQLGIVQHVVTPQRQEKVQGCIERAMPKRLRLNKERAEVFLKANWGGWDVCRQPMHYSPTIIVELAKLCRLGVGKEKATTLLQEQIFKRRISKTPGLPKDPKLRKADVINAIAQIAKELQGQPASHLDSPSKSRKRGRVEDYAYSGPKGKRPALKVVISSNTSVKNLPHSADAEPEVEKGRGQKGNLSEVEGSSSYSLGGLAGSCSPQDPHSTAPSSLPVTPSPRCKLHTMSPQSPARSTSLVVKPSKDTFKYSFMPDQPPVESYHHPSDLLRNGPISSQWHLSPPTNEENMLRSGQQSLQLPLAPPINKEHTPQNTEPPGPDKQISEQASVSPGPSHVSAQALQELRDGQRINASVVNAVLEKIVSMPDTFLVDSNELAKFDSTSRWNAQRVNGTDSAHLLPPRENRRLRALSALRLIMPFHHPNKEHWSLFVASRKEEAYTIEHYDSLRRKGRDHSPNDVQTVMGYLRWLVIDAGKQIEMISKDCAVQRDGVNCGIHLLANAEAIIKNRDVPTTIDTDALRCKYWSLLRPAVDGPSISTSPSPIDSPPASTFLPPSLIGRPAIDTVMEHTVGHDVTDKAPTDDISRPPPTDDVTGHTSAETAIASPSRIGVTAPAKINVTNQASTGSTIATASPSGRNSGQKSSPIFSSAADVLPTQPENGPILVTPFDQSRSASTRETDQPDLKSVQETQRIEAQAGSARWKDLLEATRRDLEDLESRLSELQRLCQDSVDRWQEADTRVSVWQSNLENLDRIPWKTLPKDSSRDKDPSLDDFCAMIRQKLAAAREEKTRLGQEINGYKTRQRALEEPIQRAKRLVKVRREKQESWQRYVQHLKSFVM